MSNYSINLETTSYAAWDGIWKLDKSLVGTKNYMGLAFFWDHEIKYWLRDATIAKRKRIHNLILDSGEEPIEESGIKYFQTNDAVRSIVEKVLKIQTR
mgnify:CR=1 FL=1